MLGARILADMLLNCWHGRLKAAGLGKKNIFGVLLDLESWSYWSQVGALMCYSNVNSMALFNQLSVGGKASMCG